MNSNENKAYINLTALLFQSGLDGLAVFGGAVRELVRYWYGLDFNIHDVDVSLPSKNFGVHLEKLIEFLTIHGYTASEYAHEKQDFYDGIVRHFELVKGDLTLKLDVVEKKACRWLDFGENSLELFQGENGLELRIRPNIVGASGLIKSDIIANILAKQLSQVGMRYIESKARVSPYRESDRLANILVELELEQKQEQEQLSSAGMECTEPKVTMLPLDEFNKEQFSRRAASMAARGWTILQ